MDPLQNCGLCNNKFTQFQQQVKLLCGHQVCQFCCDNQSLNPSNQIICHQCLNKQENLNGLGQSQELKQEIAALTFLQQGCKNSYKELIKEKTNITTEICDFIGQTLFKESNILTYQLAQKIKEIQLRLSILENSLEITKVEPKQFEILNEKSRINLQQIQDIICSGSQNLKKMQNLRINLPELFNKVTEQFQLRLLGQGLKNQIFTIFCNKKIMFTERSKQFKNEEDSNLNYQPFTTYVEQKQEDCLVVSNLKNFDIFRFDKNLESFQEKFAMNYERNFHKTTFDNQNQIFIISGSKFDQQWQDVSECEIFQ